MIRKSATMNLTKMDVKAICSCFALALVIGPSESSCILDLVLDFLLYKGALIISFKYKDLLFFLFPCQVRRKHNKENKRIQADLKNKLATKLPNYARRLFQQL